MGWWNDVERYGYERERAPREVQTFLKELVPTEDGGAVLKMSKWEADTKTP